MKIEDYGLIGELQTAALVVWTDRSTGFACPGGAQSSAASATREPGAAEPGLKVAAR